MQPSSVHTKAFKAEPRQNAPRFSGLSYCAKSMGRRLSLREDLTSGPLFPEKENDEYAIDISRFVEAAVSVRRAREQCRIVRGSHSVISSVK